MNVHVRAQNSCKTKGCSVAWIGQKRWFNRYFKQTGEIQVSYFYIYTFLQQIELDELNRTQQELKQGSGKLQDILQKLEREQVK